MLSPSQRVRARGRQTAPGQLVAGNMSLDPARDDGYNIVTGDLPNRGQLTRTRIAERNPLDGYKIGEPFKAVPGELVVRNPQQIGPPRGRPVYPDVDDADLDAAAVNGGSPQVLRPAVTVTDPRQDSGVLAPDNNRSTYPHPLWDVPDTRQMYLNNAVGFGPRFEGYSELRNQSSNDPLINPLGRIRNRPSGMGNGYSNDYASLDQPLRSRQRVSEYIRVEPPLDDNPERIGRVGKMPTEIEKMFFEVDFLRTIETHPDKKAQLAVVARQLMSYGQKMRDLESIGGRTSIDSTIPKVRRILDDNGKEYQTFSPSIDRNKVAVNIGPKDEIIVSGVVFPPLEVINKSSGPLDSEAIRKYIRWMLIFLIIAVILIILYVAYRFARWLFCWESCSKCKGKKSKCGC